MCEQRDISVPRKHHTDYRDEGYWGTTKTRNVNRVVDSFNTELVMHELPLTGLAYSSLTF